MRAVSIKRYALQDILPHIRVAIQEHGPEKIELDGEIVAVTSVRLQTFAFRGTRCVACGIQGTHFRKERTQPEDHRPHLMDLPPTSSRFIATVRNALTKLRKEADPHALPTVRSARLAAAALEYAAAHLGGQQTDNGQAATLRRWAAEFRDGETPGSNQARSVEIVPERDSP